MVTLGEESLLCGLEEDGGHLWTKTPSNDAERMIRSLCDFCEANWTGPSSFDSDTKHFDELALDGEEIRAGIQRLDLLYDAIEVCKSLSDQPVSLWWKLRCNRTHQAVLDGPSPTLFKSASLLVDDLNKLKDNFKDPRLKTLLALEINQFYMFYGKTEKSQSSLDEAKQYEQFKLELTGAPGKRTKYQCNDIAQLTLRVELGVSKSRVSPNETHSKSDLPVVLKLDDDVRLDKINYKNADDAAFVELTAVEQLISLNELQHLRISQPKDALADEELYPYLDLLLSQKHGPWAARISALLIKCKLESNHKRTIERSMMQCEETVSSFQKNTPTVSNRLSYFWASGMPLMLQSKSLLADLMLSIGLVKSALDLYLKLQLWEEVIACYTVLELRHKAAEIIQQQIDQHPTAKLYCLLGDATDDITLYQKAWEFSGMKSSRAQRHWGDYLFLHKKYDECIPHYQKSCEINSLQENVWLKLGYAALTVENYDLSANAYRRYTYLEPHSFEAWNNLAKVYIKQGNKQRAYKALSEALKYNYDNWQIWENMIVVSIDTGHFDDVIRCYHRLLDLKKNYHDVEVLTVLVSAIVQDKNDADGNPTQRLKPKMRELFGRITASLQNNADIWELYSNISENAFLQCQRLTKSCILLNQINSDRNEERERRILDMAVNLGNLTLSVLKDSETINESLIRELFSSSRLAIKAIIAKLSRDFITKSSADLNHLQDVLESITSELKKR